MYHTDRIAKPKPGYFFPGSASEFKKKILELGFEMWGGADAGMIRSDRPDLLFISGNKPLEHGFPLTCFRRRGDIAIFSLPDELFSKQLASAALELALKEFSKIDRGPELSTKQNAFFVYRAYIGEMGKVTITKNLVRSGHRSYLDFERAIDPRKLRGEESVILELKP